MSHDVAVVILAGGEGRRIGGHKPQLMLAGERLIDRALREACGWSDCIAVAVRHSSQVDPVAARLIFDDQAIEGPLAGLVSALRFGVESGRQLLLTIPADMPFLPDDLPPRLTAEIGDAACALASSGGHVHPVCSLWRTSALDHVATYVADGQRSLRGFAALVGFKEVDWPPQPFDPFFNINTADDLAEAERRLGG